MNTPPRQTQSTGQPMQVGFQTPQRPNRPELFEPPAIIRYSKMRRVGEIPDHVIQDLASKFNNLVNTQ